jgi:hypothetical protein
MADMSMSIGLNVLIRFTNVIFFSVEEGVKEFKIGFHDRSDELDYELFCESDFNTLMN